MVPEKCKNSNFESVKTFLNFEHEYLENERSKVCEPGYHQKAILNFFERICQPIYHWKAFFFFFFFFCKVHFFAHKASFSLIPYYIQKSVLQSYLCNGNQDLKAFIIIIIIITIIINTIIIIITGLFIVYNLKKLLR